MQMLILALVTASTAFAADPPKPAPVQPHSAPVREVPKTPPPGYKPAATLPPPTSTGVVVSHVIVPTEEDETVAELAQDVNAQKLAIAGALELESRGTLDVSRHSTKELNELSAEKLALLVPNAYLTKDKVAIGQAANFAAALDGQDQVDSFGVAGRIQSIYALQGLGGYVPAPTALPPQRTTTSTTTVTVREDPRDAEIQRLKEKNAELQAEVTDPNADWYPPMQ